MESRLEEQYLREYDPSQYDRPSVTVDILVFTIYRKKLCALLIKRDMPPYIGKWAIPGGFIKIDESADQAAARKLREETGIEGVRLEQLYTFSAVDRDPRTRVISIVYFVAVPYDKLRFEAGSGVKSAELFTVGQIQGNSVSGPPEISSSWEGAGRKFLLTTLLSTMRRCSDMLCAGCAESWITQNLPLISLRTVLRSHSLNSGKSTRLFWTDRLTRATSAARS